MAAAAGLAVAGTAGCAGILGGGGSEPESTVKDYVTALDEGDVETANDLVHPDGSVQEIGDEGADMLEQAEFTLDSTELVEEGEDRAVVEASITTEFMGEEETTDGRFELRTHDGEWKIHSEPS